MKNKNYNQNQTLNSLYEERLVQFANKPSDSPRQTLVASASPLRSFNPTNAMTDAKVKADQSTANATKVFDKLKRTDTPKAIKAKQAQPKGPKKPDYVAAKKPKLNPKQLKDLEEEVNNAMSGKEKEVTIKEVTIRDAEPEITYKYDIKSLNKLKSPVLLRIADEAKEKNGETSILKDGKSLRASYDDLMFDMQSGKDSKAVLKNWLTKYFDENLNIKKPTNNEYKANKVKIGKLFLRMNIKSKANRKQFIKTMEREGQLLNKTSPKFNKLMNLAKEFVRVYEKTDSLLTAGKSTDKIIKGLAEFTSKITEATNEYGRNNPISKKLIKITAELNDRAISIHEDIREKILEDTRNFFDKLA